MRAGRRLLVTLFLVVVGALLLKGVATEGASDPRASIDNGGPRGLLALATWLAGRGIVVDAIRAHGDLPASAPALLVVPPPEAARWREDEVAPLIARVRSGDLDVVILCDEDESKNGRLDAWRDATGLACAPGEPGDGTVGWRALGDGEASLFLRREGRVLAKEGAPALPLFVDEAGHTRAAAIALGAGRVVLFGSTTPFSNDGLAQRDDAAVFLSLVRGGRAVFFDEAHHRTRGSDALAAAAAGPGPRTAFLALLLLVPLSLLSLAPRPGDPPRADDDYVPLAAASQARALAALVARLPTRASSDIGAVDRDPPGRGSSRA